MPQCYLGMEVIGLSGTKKPMEALCEQVRKIASQMDVLRPRRDKAHEMAAKWLEKSRQLDEQYHGLSERIAGLNGHIRMMDFGATHYQVISEPGQWSYIRFFDADGKLVRDPEWYNADGSLKNGGH